MSEINDKEYQQGRDDDVNKILRSIYPRKVVVAGAGTGKSFLFEQAIKKKKAEGKNKFLAITFVGRLTDTLADDLAGLAETMTLHGFARKFVLDNYPKGWSYYPKIFDIINEDLDAKGVIKFEIGDENYAERTKYYRAVGERDVVYYAVQICKKEEKIPRYDLILVDEFQDFNETEAEFINLLAAQNEVLIVGDDDQALYEFKGSFSKSIRDKYAGTSADFESHTLRYCSRCTDVVIKAFHNIVKHFSDRGKLGDRIKKEYICYLPEKKKDSDLNKKILLLENILPGAIATKIKSELSNILENQRIKSVLIVGEGQTCKSSLELIARSLREFGFKNVDYGGYRRKVFFFKENVIAGLKIIGKDSNDVLAWRLLSEEMGETEIKKIISENYTNKQGFINALPDEFKKQYEKSAKILNKILNEPESGRKIIASSSVEKLSNQIVEKEKERKNLFMDQLIDENSFLPRPLVNLDITVCNILGSKGLGADVVFLVGFDQGKLPMKNEIRDSEIYQMLVALTRAKKRIYLINTTGKSISSFINCIGEELIERV